MKSKTNLTLLLVAVAITACQQNKTSDFLSFTERQELPKGEKTVITGRISNLHVYPH